LGSTKDLPLCIVAALRLDICSAAQVGYSSQRARSGTKDGVEKKGVAQWKPEMRPIIKA